MYRVPFSKTYLDFELPANMRGTYAASRPMEPLADVEKAIDKALAAPINSPPLSELAKQGDIVCIVFTDITRNTPEHLLVPALLAELNAAGVRDEDITLLCGTGLHRPSTPQEKVIKLGQSIVGRYRVLDHDPFNLAGLEDLGITESGIPLSVNSVAYQADLLIATGIVEPHQYAGYSGGPKTVAIGAAGESMIAHTHGPQMVDHPGTRLGKIEGNIFHQAVTEAARRAGLDFILNVVQDDHKRPVVILAGRPEDTFEGLVKAAKGYQASRAASQLFFAPASVVKDGSVFIVPAPTPEGAGQGDGERRFLETMRSGNDMLSLLAELRRTGYPPGAQRAFVMAKVLEKNHVIIVGTETPEVVRQLHMIPAADMDEAFRIAVSKIGRDDLEVLIVQRALLTLLVGRTG
jgi:nickel-dependent lactate racemase